MATANTISAPASSKQAASLQTIFGKIQHIYFKEYTNGKGMSSSAVAAGVDLDIELPTLEDSVSFDTGSVDNTEINLLDGTVWTSKSTKGDSSITFQVASLDSNINALFLTAGTAYNSATGIVGGSGYTGQGYKLDVKKTLGTILMTDDTETTCIVLPNIEMTGSLVASDGDNPAYFNVTVTPKANSDGDSIIIFKK